MLEDRRLLLRLRGGDREALGQIYEKYKDKLLTVASCLVVDISAAEDCLHDVFVSLAAHAERLHIRRSLRGYLTVSITNRARDQWRRKSRMNVSITELPETADRLAGPAEQVQDCEEWGRLMAALKELPYEQREIITLHLQGEMTFREIGRELAISINTVQSRYRYGIKNLRKFLKEDASVKSSKRPRY